MQEIIPTLKFVNPTFRNGFNVTVRFGTKWLNQRSALIQVAPEYKRVVTLETVSVQFNKIDPSYLMFEHDESCRTLEGLSKVMKQLYPEFTDESIVTVAIFHLNSHIPVVGEYVYVPDMMGPVCVGEIQEVIELHDGFWEIHNMGKYNSGDEKWGRFVAHQITDWYDNIGYGANPQGWFDRRAR